MLKSTLKIIITYSLKSFIICYSFMMYHYFLQNNKRLSRSYSCISSNNRLILKHYLETIGIEKVTNLFKIISYNC